MWDSDQDDAIEHAFIFDREKGVRDLNDLVDPQAGWTLIFARDINDSGQVVGYGEFNGERRGFILILSTTTVADNDGNGGGCFIATAGHRSSMAK
jgi:hypothetical protein